MSNLFEVKHPLIDCHLTKLRDAETGSDEFRQLVRRLATLVAYEATKDLKIDPQTVVTPLTEMVGSRLGERVGLVPILRGGLGMIDPILDLIPTAEVWHLGLYRDEATAQPVEYYSKLPPGNPVDTALIVDPMLATGGSAMAALETLKKWGVKRTKIASLLASREGIDALQKEFPETQIYVCRVDPILNDKKYIVPGLGDAGDRIFNTLKS